MHLPCWALTCWATVCAICSIRAYGCCALGKAATSLRGCVMTALIFLLMAIAMMTASAGYRGTAIGLFGVSFVAAVLWLDRYAIEMPRLPL